MSPLKNIRLGKIKYFIFFFVIFYFFQQNLTNSVENASDKFIEIKILDKVNSKNSTLTLNIGEEEKFENLLIKALKCSNSEFDDNPEITAYLQVKDITFNDKNKVYIFNDWTFASSPALRPFDHPIYDIWLTKCYIK
ncbi:MAG: DUF2155 domain-containing protein [Rickettsiales bacterium TMED289]|nr:MAG: DUF2155 domain-containing protein [Rickettsiales bacterium TMED289]|tara:strand:- start:2756 stop:3166 length:411 start_codon:yes stop_codon:yes gene_type:complete